MPCLFLPLDRAMLAVFVQYYGNTLLAAASYLMDTVIAEWYQSQFPTQESE